jgi:hypothetical protein
MSVPPKISGPVKGGMRGWPFGRPMVDFTAHGYREEEYFLGGTATSYRARPGTQLGADGRWQAQPGGSAPYKTRLVVYRPEDPSAFNGTVIVSWNNVSAGFENFALGDNPDVFKGGYAYAAVSTQRAGLDGLPPSPMGLLAWDPERYGSLSIPSDDYSFDIFSQAGRAVGPGRSPNPIDPMGGLEVRRLLATGGSQSAGRLASYINAVQPLSAVFDAFLVTLYFGAGSPLEVGDLVFNPGASSGPLPSLPAHLLRDDLDARVMIVNSELEAVACCGVRQPATDRFRYWEVAGTSHVSLPDILAIAPRAQRDLGRAMPAMSDINQVSMAPVVAAALHHMQSWLQGGPSPPIQPLIEFAGDPPEIVRDEHGIGCGGIRLPQIEAPIATNRANPSSPDRMTRLGGSCVPFAPDKLRKLYGDSEGYLHRFAEAARMAASRGVILPRDVEPLIGEARSAVLASGTF